jgi:hypothetical protein
MLAARWIPSNPTLQVALGFALAMACYALHVFVETPAAASQAPRFSKGSALDTASRRDAGASAPSVVVV